jgi:hypothetical protein
MNSGGALPQALPDREAGCSPALPPVTFERRRMAILAGQPVAIDADAIAARLAPVFAAESRTPVQRLFARQPGIPGDDSFDRRAAPPRLYAAPPRRRDTGWMMTLLALATLAALGSGWLLP